MSLASAFMVFRVACTAWAAVVLAGLLTGCRAPSPSFDLVRHGRPAAVIVLPSAAPDDVSAAVDDFNADLAQVSGVGLARVRALDDPAAEGLGQVVFELVRADLSADDAFSIEFPDARTLRIRATARSVRWALNHLLTEHAGVRHLFPGPNGTHFPRRDIVTVPCFPVTRHPAFTLQRNLSYPVANWQIGLNAKDALRFNHELTVFAFPVERYGPDQSWPPEIMPVIRGEKKTEVDPRHPRRIWQPCYTHPAAVAVAVENITDYLSRHPGTPSISLAVNDSGGFCECEVCRSTVGERRNAVGMPHYSESYYAWVNQVAEAVLRNHPDVHFGVLAYREVMEPPSFDVHPRVVPFLCFDLYACLDPGVRAERLALMDAWRERLPGGAWGHWDYSYARPRIQLPRIYFTLTRDLLREMHARGARAQFVEAYPHAGDGPAKYLNLTLLWDVDADMDAVLDDWYAACVGPAAAPDLKAYFDFWETFWSGEAIRQTPWFREGKSRVYLHPGVGDYLVALQPGDMAASRRLLEQAASRVETPEQQARAAILLREFEFFELSARAYLGEELSPHGSLDSAAQALTLLAALPGALEAAQARRELLETTPEFNFNLRRANLDFTPFPFENFNRAAVYADDPSVADAVRGLARDPSLPARLRTQADLLLRLAAGTDAPENRFVPLQPGAPFGGTPGAHPSAFRGLPAVRRSLSGDRAVVSDRPVVRPETRYMFTARVWLPDTADPGTVQLWLHPHDSRAGRDRTGKIARHPTFKLEPGRWTLVASTLETPPETDSMHVYLVFRDLDGQTAWLADWTLVEMAQEGERE